MKRRHSIGCWTRLGRTRSENWRSMPKSTWSSGGMRNTSPDTSNRKELRCWLWQRPKEPQPIRTKPQRTLSFNFWPERTIAEHEMTKHIVQLPNPDGSLLLRELNHRIRKELTSAIYAVSAKAVQSDSVAVKAALLDVVDLLHQCADVHQALHMPDQGRLADAARYLQQVCFSITKYRLDRLAIRVLFSADDLRLEGERCWKLGLIVSELLTNVARHAQFDARHPELRVELMLAGNVVKCRVSDNGSAPEPIRRGRGLAIIGV